ncbi:zinc finger protein 585A-like [Gigantopelta aegis]|uniref:zinc finger protein 585A-like n=1 Tax=Gigantopelta aegis TaxID=1735272 RepID=UPI001B88A69B|nr:zinc finger protein 585A-like [Gigantopelta aegis]
METLCDAVDILNSHVMTRANLNVKKKGNRQDDVQMNASAGDVLLLESPTTDVVIKQELIETDDNNASSMYEVQTADGEVQQIVQYIQIENVPTEGQTTTPTDEYESTLEGEDFEVCEINMSDLKEIADGKHILQVLYVPQDFNMASTTGDMSQKCLICSESFKTVDLLKIHMNTHNPRPHFRELRAIMTQTDESLLQGNTVNVTMPSVQFENSEPVESDQQINAIDAENILNPVAQINSNLGGMKHTKKVLSKTSNTCHICSKTFVSASKLIRHSYLHTGEKPFACDICHRRFTQIAHLKVHVELHTGQYVYRKLYQCPHCGKKFTSKSNIQTHLVIHTGVKAYKCHQCGKSFALASHLKRHEFSHTGQKPFTCGTCGKSFTTKCSMIIHSRQHSGERPFSCNMCGRSFYDKTHLRRHIKSHKKLYKCNKCPSRFMNILMLNSHLKTHNTVNDSIQTTEEVVKLVQSIRKSTPKLGIPKVRKYRTQQPLSPSLPVVHLPPEEPETALEDFALNILNVGSVLQHDAAHSYSLKSKLGDSKEIKNKCNLCGKGFAHPSNLLKHKKTVHSSLRPYKCDVCQRSFTQNAHLKVHKKTLHPDPGEKILYQCGVCFRQFNVQKNAERHMKHVHLGQEQKKNLKCKLCEKTFAFPVQLKRHLKKHEDETSRECDQCGKKFTSLWHFSMHYRTHTGEKPYECEVCLLRFGDQSTLTRHKRGTHENVSRVTCGVCKKTFSSKGHLVKHLKRHPETRRAVLMAQGSAKEYMPVTASQKYQCGECQEEFTYFANAFAHMKVHSENGEVPLKCPFCNADFSDMSAMKKHIRQHTGEPEPEKSQVCNFCSKRFYKKKTLKTHLEKMHSTMESNKRTMRVKLESELASQSSINHISSVSGITALEANEHGEVMEQTLPFYSTSEENNGNNQLTVQVLKQEEGAEDDIITVVVMDPSTASQVQDEQIKKQQTLENEAARVLHSLNNSKAAIIELDIPALEGAQHIVEPKEIGPSTDKK